jgi:hypothetical protein
LLLVLFYHEADSGSLLTLQVNISVMKVLRGGGSSQESPATKVEASSLVRRPSGRGGWVSVNVEELLTKWFENPKDNHGIVLHAIDGHNRSIVVTDHAEEDGALVSRWDGRNM